MTKESHNLHSVNDILCQLQRAHGDREQVSVDNILSTIGRRSFGPIVLAIGLFLAVPGVSDIPSVPSIFGALIVLIGLQIVWGRAHIWLPGWILRRSVRADRLEKAIDWLQRPANAIDKIVKPRWHRLATPLAQRLIAIVTIILALLTPFMEVVPLSANVAGVAFVFFGLGLVSQDGLMNAIGLLFCATLAGLLIYFLIL